MNCSTADRRSPLGLLPGHPAPRLYDRVVEIMRARPYSIHTQQTYCHRVKRCIYFHNLRHLAEPAINAFLTHLAVKEKVSASTQNRPLSVLLFLYRHVIGREVGDLGHLLQRPVRLAAESSVFSLNRVSILCPILRISPQRSDEGRRDAPQLCGTTEAPCVIRRR